jgi:outer membrane biosynthesis protein TonB
LPPAAADIHGLRLTPSAGLQIVRIAWVTAILAGVLAILFGLLSGTDGGDSTGGSHQAASAPGFVFEAQEKPERPGPAVLRDDRNKPADVRISEERPSGSDAVSGSTDQPGDAGGGAPDVTSQPAPQPKPTPAPRPNPPPAPRPKPPPPPPQVPVTSQPTLPEPVQAPVNIANNNDGP